ncbi:MAG: GNAT family N-acetyltransferase [Candidatus Dormibacteria bacterium]
MIGIRNANDGDIDAIAALVNADRVLGLPRCRPDDIRLAVLGAATMERAWWDNFRRLETIVATNGSSVVGAASFAVHSTENRGYLLWLEAREEPSVVTTLLDATIDRLSPLRNVRGFWIATPLALGMEALPVEHRPVTHDALLRRGFSAHDEWLYMVGEPVSRGTDVAHVEQVEEQKWQLTISDAAGGVIGRSTAELAHDNVGIVWWLEVQATHRRKSYGRALLLQAMQLLGAAGARRLILYVDHDDPSSRDRRPAIHLYESVGFRTVDHLWSYELDGEQPG